MLTANAFHWGPGKTRRCSGCKRELPLTEEHWYRRKGGLRRCKRCHQEYSFRGLTAFMQQRILARKKAAVGRQP